MTTATYKPLPLFLLDPARRNEGDPNKPHVDYRRFGASEK